MASNGKNSVSKAQAELHRQQLQQLLRHDDNRRCVLDLARCSYCTHTSDRLPTSSKKQLWGYYFSVIFIDGLGDTWQQPSSPVAVFQNLSLPRRCADCLARGPTWASVNLGVFMCLNCSGVHRSLGVDISKVRSTTLDTWLPEQVAFVQSMGNRRANLFWEGRLPGHFRRPAEGDMSSLRHFISDKYRHVRRLLTVVSLTSRHTLWPQSGSPSWIPNQYMGQQSVCNCFFGSSNYAFECTASKPG